jgi:hypothetical protein
MELMFTSEKFGSARLAAIDTNALFIGIFTGKWRFGRRPSQHVER